MPTDDDSGVYQRRSDGDEGDGSFGVHKNSMKKSATKLPNLEFI